ncbi:hypothetical protein ABVF61_00395 [Roseibium sp. HPY-6]|uniref:hypothetical protein n=1 Tax=Roseibium sp. HPY-6 TaxID=3229852 RepID=UPI00338E3961
MAGLEYIEMLRNEARDADIVSANTLAKNALSLVENALRWFDADSNCRLAGDTATVTCQRLAKNLIAMAPTEAEKTVIEEFRAEALQAIDLFKASCERCGPSGMAKALGV